MLYIALRVNVKPVADANAVWSTAERGFHRTRLGLQVLSHTPFNFGGDVSLLPSKLRCGSLALICPLLPPKIENGIRCDIKCLLGRIERYPVQNWNPVGRRNPQTGAGQEPNQRLIRVRPQLTRQLACGHQELSDLFGAVQKRLIGLL